MSGVLSRSLSPVTKRARLAAHLEQTRRALAAAPGEITALATDLWRRDPLVYRTVMATRGLRKGKTRRELAAAVDALELTTGKIAVPNGIPSGERLVYRAERAAALKLLGRSASELEPVMLSANATAIRPVDGGDDVKIGERTIHTEVLKAIGPTRGVVRIAPGYQEAGPAFFVLADALNRQGIEVHLMDHQWAGSSQGAVGPGQLDSPEGVARDSAVVDAVAMASAARSGLKFAAVGQSMGGGAGTILEQVLLAGGSLRGVIGRDGDRPIVATPGTHPMVLFAPYAEATPSAINHAFSWLGEIPIAGEAALPMAPIPRFNVSSKTAQAEIAGAAARGEISGRPVAFPRGTLTTAERAAARNLANPVTVVMGDRDLIAHPTAARDSLPEGARLVRISGAGDRDHINQHTPAVVPKMVDAVLDSLALPAL